jgi:hypothetical protein
VCNVKRTGGTPPTSAAITCQGQLFGPSSRLSELLDPLLSAARPTQRKVATLSFLAAQQLWAGCTAGHCAPRAANPYEVKSAFFSDPMPREAITTLLDELEAWPGSAATSPPVGFELNSWGGAMGRVPSSATAFVHRHARVLMIVGATWSARDGAARVAANRAWLRNLYSRVRPYSSGQAYQNLIDPHLDDCKHAYYGSNLPRLIEVKRRYDPDEVFRFAQGIPTG